MSHTLTQHPVAGNTLPAATTEWFEPWLDRGLIPDVIMRAAIRRQLQERISTEEAGTLESRHERLRTFLNELRAMPIAVQTDAANAQHYEVPAEFFQLCLGPRLKYSGCLWNPGTRTLGEAEEAMLQLTCERAQLSDGQDILELGCGWGSLTLWMLEKYPLARITAVSNSRSQKEFILAQAKARGLRAPEIITADMNHFSLDRKFDRVVSVEMFEHMKNYELLLERVASMMKDNALLFVHIFTHTRIAYHFESAAGWMSTYFFTGGTMPSDHLLHYFQKDVRLVDHWRVDGSHYQRTAEAWLSNIDEHRTQAIESLRKVYGGQSVAWFHRWRVFFMACAELWGFCGGKEWIVSHYLFRKT